MILPGQNTLEEIMAVVLIIGVGTLFVLVGILIARRTRENRAASNGAARPHRRPAQPQGHYDIFISYRREDGYAHAKLLHDRLVAANYRVFFDMEQMRSGQFNKQLYRHIQGCTDFVLVLSPNSLQRCRDRRDWVRLEIEHALKQKKNIIPVCLVGFDWRRQDLPSSIRPLQMHHGITIMPEYYDAGVEKLKGSLLAQPRNSFLRLRRNAVT